MSDLQTLLDVEAIKRLRARNSRLLDAKRWPAWGLTFTADAVFEVPDVGLRLEGREAIVQAVSAGMAGVRSVHQVHAPEIELTGPDGGEGVWAMHDSLERAGRVTNGFGHYVEEYVRDEGEWRIRHFRLDRIRVDG